MVSVLNVGAADASNGKSEATISPRMMNESGCGFGLKEGSCVCLRLRLMNKRNLKEGWAVGVKTVVYAAFEMIVDDEGVVDGKRMTEGERRYKSSLSLCLSSSPAA